MSTFYLYILAQDQICHLLLLLYSNTPTLTAIYRMVSDHQLAALRANMSHIVLKWFIRNSGVTIMPFGWTGLKGILFITLCVTSRAVGLYTLSEAEYYISRRTDSSPSCMLHQSFLFLGNANYSL